MNRLRKLFIFIRRLGIKKTLQRVARVLGIKESVDYLEKRYIIWKEMPEEQYPSELVKWYFENTGRNLDLENPKTFNEKLQWLKLYDATPLKTRLADKYEVRQWIKDQIGEEYLIPLIGVWDSFDEIDFASMPKSFALKASHGSGWNIIVKDKDELDIADAKTKFDKWLSTNFAFVGGLELHYKNIKPRIIAEKFIENVNGLIDYRFYCFHGEPKQVWVDIFSGTPQHKREIYDMNWERVQMKCTWPRGGGLLDNKPLNFEKMKLFAKKLSHEFKFVRVDFFEVDRKLYMGEMTFIPMSGIGEFEPEEWDSLLGDMIKLD